MKPTIHLRPILVALLGALTLIWWGTASAFIRDDVRVRVIGGAVVFACLFLSWIAFQLHRKLAAEELGPQWYRFSGLVFAAVLWSGLTFASTRRSLADQPWSAELAVWTFISGGTLSLPIFLWGGLVYRATMWRVFGRFDRR